MSKLKQELEQIPSGEALPVAGLIPLPQGFPGQAPAATGKGRQELTEIGPARFFRDKVYTSRTLVMPSGQTIPVARGLALADGDDQYEFLNGHPDLELLKE